MKADLAEEHRWLEQLVGKWRLVFHMPEGSDHSDSGGDWQETARSLNGTWVVCETTGTMPDGSSATNILSLGYDPLKKRYVGSFVSSAMTNLWVYEGTLDETGKVLTLDCDGPDFGNTGRTARYQDIMTIRDADTRNFSSRVQTADGTWQPIMSCDYHRVSAV
ncbi:MULTISPECIES: DUF1579 domain-containing protein [unclassified Rhizobium]|uniref:DUF1579 domain-containing protein n=1 Tax=unclassified Rhizobium TaxID=2613769 RepID=UPI000712F160|nr:MULTISPECIES: DUF1579 domain-containing protein [unclassified Rhizobium]KQS89677.1 hypothetical protein ASG42_13405 [Rhizobium sp. Leaf391]KQS94957.1 hypothetical protein ASG50_27355 [Rhizobium sp. Leaf386]KQU01333.1 hypothetical protein ASG68_06135 [Rhizobium sp. Leaf453]